MLILLFEENENQLYSIHNLRLQLKPVKSFQLCYVNITSMKRRIWLELQNSLHNSTMLPTQLSGAILHGKWLSISQTQTQTQAQTQPTTDAETVQFFAFPPRNQILCLGVFVVKLNTPCHPRPSCSFPHHPHFRILLVLRLLLFDTLYMISLSIGFLTQLSGFNKQYKNCGDNATTITTFLSNRNNCCITTQS